MKTYFFQEFEKFVGQKEAERGALAKLGPEFDKSKSGRNSDDVSNTCDVDKMFQQFEEGFNRLRY